MKISTVRRKESYEILTSYDRKLHKYGGPETIKSVDKQVFKTGLHPLIQCFKKPVPIMRHPPHSLQTLFHIAVGLTLFIATEYLFDRAGLDTLADYNEFLTGQQETVILEHTFSAENFGLPPVIFG